MSDKRKSSSYTPSEQVDVEVRILESETASTPEPEISEDVQDAPNQDAPTPAADDNTAPEPQPKKRGSGKGFLKAIVLLLHTAFLTLGATTAWAQIYVDASATGSNNGTSWANAYTLLYDAIQAATWGSQIWVANGTYYPDEPTFAVPNDASRSFEIRSGMSLYGGFAGGETALNQRNIAANPTILSGDIDQDGTGESYHVVTATDVSTMVLDGFTITKGRGNNVSGGGLYLSAASGTISNCTITDNSSTYAGGGLYIGATLGTVAIDNTTISNNTTGTSGGGIYSYFANVTITNSTISGNTASNHGGGIMTAGDVGAPGDVVVTITGTSITDNTASEHGGGIYHSAGYATMTLTNSTVSGNEAMSGGGIYNESVMTIESSTINGNEAVAGIGGGITSLQYDQSRDFVISNSTISGNTSSGSGGGMYVEYFDPTIASTTIFGNSAGGLGGGVFWLGHTGRPNLHVDSSILWGNDDGDGTGATAQLTSWGDVIAIMSYSIVQGGVPPNTQNFTGNLTDDPRLGPLQDNGGPTATHLPDSNSPTIDMGSCGFLGDDQRGETRPYNYTARPNALDGCDIGAVELQADEVLGFDCVGVCYVDASVGGGSNDGTSWANAFSKLQDALLASNGGDEIWVANGTYYPDEGIGRSNNDRSSTFSLRTRVELYGGFAGGEGSLGDRDIAANPAILSGDIDQSGTLTGNAYHVVTGGGTDSTALLDGFTITGGNADGSSSNDRGAGVFNQSGSPTIANSYITGNQASSHGAGMWNQSSSSPTIVNTTISVNTSSIDGGAMYNDGNSRPKITNSTISGNVGGGIYNGYCGAGNPVIASSTITGNTIGTNGGGLSNASCSPVVTSTILWGNSDGGGTDATAQIYNVSGGAPTVSYSFVQGGLSGGTVNGGNNLYIDPLLASLADNGGPTPTHLPAFASPIIDAGSCQSGAVSTDQRGDARPYNASNSVYPNADDGCDVGAVELQSNEVAFACNGVCYVDASRGGGAHDGTSWSNAFRFLQDALIGAYAGDQIWVANGTYYPDQGVGQVNNDRTSTFTIHSGVKLYGGFAGVETTLGQRDVAVWKAILSGDLLGDDGTTGKGENAYHVVTVSGTDTSTVLDGVTITAGYANGSAPNDRGAGVYNEGGSPKIANSYIRGNEAAAFGGGMSNQSSSSPTIINTTLYGNTAGTSGGGMFNDENSRPVIANSTISGNTGGGIRNSFCGAGNPVITNSTIVDNTIGTNGGGLDNQSCSPVVTSTIIWGNSDPGGNDATAQIYNITGAAPTVSYSVVQGGLSSGTVDSGNNLQTDPLLGSLADNGGPTPTRLPGQNSTAIDAGTCAGQTADQRAEGRPFDWPEGPYPNADDACDVGAVEVQLSDFTSANCSGVCYVDSAATGTGTGANWTNAIPLLQDALYVATNGDQIWVANGTYYPDEGFAEADDDRTSTFALKSGVTLYGGFAGGEATLGERNPVVNPAILSGDLMQDDSTTGNTENAYHVVTGSGTDATAVLDGFTVTAGNADGSSPNDQGAGILNNAGSPTIRNSTISDNNAAGAGGGIYNLGSSPSVSSSTIIGNSAASGGAMANSNGSAPVIANSTITGNSVTSNGGGIVNLLCTDGPPIIRGSTVVDNSASADGGGIASAFCSPVVTSTILWDNSDAGGMDASAQIYNITSATPTVSYSIVQDALSSNTVDGGNNLFIDPMLGALADNGGPTATMLPADISPAIDAGTCDGLTADQRGNGRPYDADDGFYPNTDDGCDIGAVETRSDDLLGIACSGICYVDASAAGAGTGESWENAIPLLQDALFVAMDGDQVWVADGTYYPDAGYMRADDDRSSTFELKNGVTLYGGFAGGEATLGERDVAANPAILSGDLMQDDGTTGNVENAYHVVTTSGTDSTAVLDGFTIVAGNANGSSPDDFGGGIFNESGSPTIANSTISGNEASQGGGMYSEGGTSSPDVLSSTIMSNVAANGGGFYSDGGSLTLVNSTVYDNSATTDGGGLYSVSSNPVISNSTVYGNSAGTDGGGFYNTNSSPQIVSTILWANDDAGGTDASAQIANFNTSAPTASFSTVQGGLSTDTQDGGNNLSSDPLLGALADNGGPTQTMLPTSSSTVIDTGSCQGQTNDQRGLSRPFDASDGTYPNADDGCDIGAVEAQADELLGIACSGICYVDASAAGAGTGESWENAIPLLQDALFVAMDGDQVWVAGGTYYPDEGISEVDNDRTATFPLKNGVALYGGFAGGESTLGERDVAANPTILSGDLMQDDLGAGNAENAYHVVTSIGTDSTALLDGFTITSGNANGGGDDNLGGGIHNGNGSPIIVNASISENTAASNGGGFYSNNGSPTIANTTIFGNSATVSGGGMSNTLGAPTIINSTIFNNSATSNGGGIYNSGASSTIANTTIFDNTATGSGGGVYNVFGLPVIRSTILWNNHDAGGTDASAQIANNLSTPTVSFSIVQGSGGSSSWESGLGTDGGNNIDDDPLLGTLQDNDGPTQTMLPDSGSVAIDNGTCLSGAVTSDQRGKARPYDFAGVPNADDGCDIGAVEVRGDSLGGGLILNAAVLLQGPYAGAGTMSDALAPSVPLDQPYSNAIYDGTDVEYDGSESVVSLPDSVVDWVLVNLRSGLGPETKVYEAPAFVKQNGEIVGLDGGPLELPIPEADYRVVVRHRNHLAIMSSSLVSFAGGTGTWDARTSLAASYTAGPTPLKNLGDGHFGMFAADGNADGQVTAPDFNLWNAATTAGATGYEPADFNLDGQVTAPDFNLWNANTTAGATSRVPD